MSGNTRTAPQEKRENVVKQDRFIPRPPLEDNGLHPLVNEQMSKDLWVLLIAFRCINALCVRTFFQPDEYFQSLEPAWQMAFGAESGAWITWASTLSLNEVNF
jgi:phosphatidylinositol glycan class B